MTTINRLLRGSINHKPKMTSRWRNASKAQDNKSILKSYKSKRGCLTLQKDEGLTRREKRAIQEQQDVYTALVASTLEEVNDFKRRRMDATCWDATCWEEIKLEEITDTEASEPAEAIEAIEASESAEDTEASEPVEDTEASEPAEDTEASEPAEDTEEAALASAPRFVSVAPGNIRVYSLCTLSDAVLNEVYGPTFR
jgi:hypothetical protein